MSSDNEWVAWRGGDCPVDPETIVEVRNRQGAIYGPKRAKRVDWKHRDPVIERLDTVAYRVVRP
jgi:hypothetical protein